MPMDATVRSATVDDLETLTAYNMAMAHVSGLPTGFHIPGDLNNPSRVVYLLLPYTASPLKFGLQHRRQKG